VSVNQGIPFLGWAGLMWLQACDQIRSMVYMLCTFFVQENSYLGSVGIQCKVGTCTYAPPGPIPPPAPARPPMPLVSHPEMATIGITAVLLVALFVATGALIMHDQKLIQEARSLDVTDNNEAVMLALIPSRCDCNHVLYTLVIFVTQLGILDMLCTQSYSVPG
jgi:hypothetical protein